MDKKHLGVLLVIAASFFWACESLVYKYAKTDDFMNLSLVRCIVVVIVGAIYLIITNKSDFSIPKKKLPPLVFVAVVGTVFADTFYFLALPHMNIVNALMIAHLQPIFVILIGFFILKEDRLTPYDYAGIGIMIVAAFLITAKTLNNIIALNIGTIWDLIVLACAIGWALVVIAVRKHLKDVHAGKIMIYRLGISAVVFLIVLAVTLKLTIPNPYFILIGAIVGVAFILYYEGLKRIKAAEVTSLETMSLLFSAILGFLILGEAITLMQGIGIAILFVGVYFLAKKENHDK